MIICSFLGLEIKEILLKEEEISEVVIQKTPVPDENILKLKLEKIFYVWEYVILRKRK